MFLLHIFNFLSMLDKSNVYNIYRVCYFCDAGYSLYETLTGKKQVIFPRALGTTLCYDLFLFGEMCMHRLRHHHLLAPAWSLNDIGRRSIDSHTNILTYTSKYKTQNPTSSFLYTTLIIPSVHTHKKLSGEHLDRF